MPERAREKKPRPDNRRGSANERGYTYRWQQVSKAFLAANPLCVDCEAEGIAAPATVVDHQVPHRGNHQLFWDATNWRPRCKPHHDRKTAMGQ